MYNTEKDRIREMKNLFYSGLLLTATLMAACSSEDNTETESQKGMTLYATVAETRATMDDDKGKWTFAFAANDVVNVGNDAVSGYYTFTNNGTNFTSSDAKPTDNAASWYAYFPGNEVRLANQTGDFSNVANYYALSGSTSATTTGIEGLSIHMIPQVAVLRIVKTNKSDECDINVKIGDNWVSSLTAKPNEVGFNVTTSTSKVSLLSKNGEAAGTYYVAVPAGVKIAIYNGSTMLKSTKEAGLTAGKYYTITTAPVSGSEYATINGTTEKIGWVQLWAGGPKFAERNVEQKMKWADAVKTGDNYVWGKNWRTPTEEEMNGFIKDSYLVNTNNVKAVYKQKDGVYGIEFTGVQPGYTKSTLFLPASDNNKNNTQAHYSTSSAGTSGTGSSLLYITDGNSIYVGIANIPSATTTYYVRPVLAN